ncbi:unnamed protein product [Cyclocybe aegerita]|uniref:PPM-type phosphatase domain-containing protein n=1 Tax=Cyclocybe aegerita TaxID=1973307 RepID=A0A8S0XDX0_CYCAE|nr:unnamed protein product [Cyclocybe aegerita]
MPLSAENSWPAGLLKIFEICRDKNKPLESRYYGPYDKLLNYCFGESFTFFAAPQKLPTSDNAARDALDFTFLIVFDAGRRPVLIAQIKDNSWANNAGLRLEADEQLRRLYSTMLDTCPLPRLWGMSLLGTSARVYLIQSTMFNSYIHFTRPKDIARERLHRRSLASALEFVDDIEFKQLAERAGRFNIIPKAARTNDRKRPAETIDPEALRRSWRGGGNALNALASPYVLTGPIPHPYPVLPYHLSPTMSYVRKTTDMGWPQEDALWIYTVLPEPKLSAELQRQSRASSVSDTDVLSFQPCPNPDHYNQDRARILDWSLPGGTWFFRGVFDGHAGHETVDYTAAKLPKIIKGELTAILEKDTQPEPSVISDALTRAISSFDESIGKAVLDLFPDQAALSNMSDAEIRQIVNDKGPNSATVLRCVRGSTVLISLTDPSKSNVWVASLGDCAAVLGTREGGEWKTRVLSTAHNGENAAEAERVRSEHPGEAACILDDRVLGAIAVTRAIGDFSFKLPAIYTSRVFLNSHPGFVIPEKVRIFTRRNLTPPYMSGVPDIKHVHLPSLDSDAAFLIMCTDGMMDLDETNRLKLEQVLSKRWVNYVGSNFDQKKNLALGLLREALGGDDIEKVSRMLTVEMEFRWMDDTTILVHRLQG